MMIYLIIGMIYVIAAALRARNAGVDDVNFTEPTFIIAAILSVIIWPIMIISGLVEDFKNNK